MAGHGGEIKYRGWWGSGFQNRASDLRVHGQRKGAIVDVTDWAQFLRVEGADEGPSLDIESDLSAEFEMLPPSHRSLLRLVNGVTVYHGMFRLFGVGRDDSYLDMASWNANETWRFAWDERLDPYWIFGENAWGDQYAYRRNEDGGWDNRVWLLEAYFMRPEVLEDSFEEFMENDFLRNAREPYESFGREVVKRYGPISAADHWVLLPSMAIGGPEDIANVMKMRSVAAMIIAGDLAVPIDNSRDEERIAAVIPWVDGAGRARLKVSFATE